MHIPQSIIAYGLPLEVFGQVQARFGGDATVHPACTLVALARALQRTPHACVLLAVPSEDDPRMIEDLRRLRKWHPAAQAVAILLPSSSIVSVLELGDLGIGEIVALRGGLDLIALEGVLTRCHTRSAATFIASNIVPHIPMPLAPVLTAALQLASTPFTTSGLAIAAKLSKRALRQRCKDAGISTPRWIIGWARALLMDHYIRESKASVRQVAKLLQYRSVSAAREQRRRYAMHPWLPACSPFLQQTREKGTEPWK